VTSRTGTANTGTSRTVVTGLGVAAPTGVGAGSYWQATLDGQRAIGRISRFDAARYPVRLAGEVRGADPADRISPRVLVQTDRWTHLALLAAGEAAAAAALDALGTGSFDIGVTTAAGAGGCAFGQREIEALWARGPGHVGPYQSIAWFYAASTGQISTHARQSVHCAARTCGRPAAARKAPSGQVIRQAPHAVHDAPMVTLTPTRRSHGG